MSGIVLEGQLAELREREIRLLYDIGDLLARLSPEGEAERKRVRDVADDLRNMFLMVVVVGEFNAGKSTFINALLEDQLLPMGITPTTEVIELIRHGEAFSRRSVLREDGVREWTHPNTGGPGVVLVDTPGTGSVFKQHEEIAKNFLHRSDLIVFVLAAKHAFAETDRLYMELIRDFGKKLVVVVNQVDMLEPREQADVRRFVQSQIESRLGLKPLIFMVSSRRALSGESDNGLEAVKAHLDATYERVSPAKQKLSAQLDFSQRLMDRRRDALQDRLTLIGHNRERTSQIQKELETHAGGLAMRLNSGADDVGRILGEVRARGAQFIDQNFRVRMPGRAAEISALEHEFSEKVVGRSMDQISDIANDYINALVDSNRAYWQGIVSRLNQMDDLLEQEVRGVDGDVYVQQRQALQDAIAIADAEMGAYSNAEMLALMKQRFDTNLTGVGSSVGISLLGLLTALAGVAVPGKVTAALLPFLGATVGGVVALGGGAFALRYWRRLRQDVKDDLNKQLDLIEKGYRQAMSELTDRERNRLLQYGGQILEPVFSHFSALADAAQEDLRVLEDLGDQIAGLRKAINEIVEPGN